MQNIDKMHGLWDATKMHVWRALSLAIVLMAMPLSAQAQVIERVEVQRVGDEAEISIRFVNPVQYLRHSPLRGGHAVHVYFQLQRDDTSPVSSTSTAVQETKTLPRGELTSGVTIHYPEPDSSMLVTFPESTTYRVRQGRDSRSIIIQVPAEMAPAVAKPVSSEEVEKHSLDYLANAKSALERNDVTAAVETLNLLLNLPPSTSSQEAQELMGVARERSGELAKALAEYDLYLKLYPEGPGAARVRERVVKLGAVPAAELAAARPVHRLEDTGWQLSGGFSQYRSHGNSSTILEPLRVIVCSPAQLANPTLVPAGEQCSQTANANAVNPQTINRTVQNTLISNLDFSTRRRTESTDSRVVVRDVDTIYYQTPTKPDNNRLNAAYFEQANRDMGYLARLGRQTGNGGGILGRFDGGLVGYNLTPIWRLNAVVGNVVEFNSPYKKNFYGASINMQLPPENWGGSVFAIQQGTEGKTDRQALGMEARYFDAKKNLYALLDYDSSFSALNIAMIQANWTGEAGTNYYLTADRRRTPILMLTSAVDTQLGMNVGSLTASVSDRAIRDDVVRITPIANMFSVGLMHPFNEKWQLGGDFQTSSMRATEASQNLPTPLPAVQGTGITFLYTVRGVGNQILFSKDMLVLSGSYIDARHTTGTATYSAQSYSATHVARPTDNWQIDTSLRLYYQNRSDGEKMTRINPVIRALYRLKDNLSVEVEANYENELRTNGASPGRNNGSFYYAGFRWDLL